jgi:tetratricopeptide (TPR) repeat protein
MHLTAIVGFLKQFDELETARNLLYTFEKYANSLEQYDELGMLYEKVKDYESSLRMLKKCAAIANNQQMYQIRCNLAKVYNHMNEPQKALDYLYINMEQNPKDGDMKMEESFSHYLLGDSVKSYEIQNELLDKDIPEEMKKRIMYNMGTFQMERGEFKSGIRNMILGGRGIGIWPPAKKPYLKWTGEITDKTLLVYAEAGIGDELINIRFMNELKKRGQKAIWIGFRKDLVDLFVSNGYNAIHNSVQLDPTEEYVYIESMSLPIYLDLDTHQLWDGPYLKPTQESLDKWKTLLPEKFITTRWSGNPYYDQDLHRVVDKDLLLEGLSKFNLPLISLQIDQKQADSRLIDVEIENWQDTLAIQYLAEYNVTSCTSTAHSAAAMDVKTVILPPIAAYYTWVPLAENNHSYWYGKNTKVFCQKKHKNWQETIDLAINHIKENIQ